MLKRPPRPSKGIIEFLPPNRRGRDERDHMLGIAVILLALVLAHLAYRVASLG